MKGSQDGDRVCRKVSGGWSNASARRRSKKVDSDPQLQANQEFVLEEPTAGDSDDDRVRFTEMTPPQISATVREMGTQVSSGIVRKWLEDQGLAFHKMEKNLAGGESADRDALLPKISCFQLIRRPKNT